MLLCSDPNRHLRRSHATQAVAATEVRQGVFHPGLRVRLGHRQDSVIERHVALLRLQRVQDEARAPVFDMGQSAGQAEAQRPLQRVVYRPQFFTGLPGHAAEGPRAGLQPQLPSCAIDAGATGRHPLLVDEHEPRTGFADWA